MNPFNEIPDLGWGLILLCGLLAVIMMANELGVPWPESIAPFFIDPPR